MLVIIGFVVGGVMVGSALIEIGQSRKVMSQMENFQVAVSMFKLKFNCKPGDCANATSFGLGPNGNGDGSLGAVSGSTIGDVYGGCLLDDSGSVCLTRIASSAIVPYLNRYRAEGQYFWVHLSASGLIAESISAMAVDNVAVTSAEMPSYFPKDATGKLHLAAFMWNSKAYIRTGFSNLQFTKLAEFSDTVLGASQMSYISSKFGYSPVGGATSWYPNELVQGHRVAPLGIFTASGLGLRFYDGTITDTGVPACVVANGAGGYRYNIANNGRCNMMWQIDY